ncbi:MAG: efflux RND transporter permease subunit [Enterobacterales bacterium]|nr:efflux RND transporter permease subunit [Enterobacterales bacterium]
MLNSIIRFSLTQRLFIGITSFILLVVGFRAWLNLPVDAFPDISPTQVKIILKAPGMTAEEIESLVTRPIETELLGIPKQQMLRSTTKYAIADITLDFVEGTDIYWARQQVNERLSNIRDSLPKDISGGVAPMSTPLSEMLMFTVENPSMSLIEKRQLLDWEIRPLLRTVEGVADVNVLGGFAKTYSISPEPLLMAQAEINFSELQAIIQNSNLNVGLGRIEKGNDILIIRSEGRLNNMSDLEQLVVKVSDNKVIRLRDVTKISIGHLARYGAVTKDGVETAEALIIALKNANAAQVVSGVKEKLAIIEKSLPAGTSINIFYDRAALINTAIKTISDALIEAVILVILLLTVFLGNYRSALAVSISLPLAALTTFYLMSAIGLSANLMSLGGIVIAIGMIVDSSVVVVENIVNRLAKPSSLPKLHLIYRATKEVALPVVSGTVIVIIVFSPLLTLSGLEGKLFSPVAMTIVFAMFAALVLSLTLVPMFASLLVDENSGKEPRLVIWLQRNYLKSLKKVLKRPAKYVASAFVVLFLSIVIFTQVGKTFMPTLDEGDIIVQLEKSPSISLASSIELDNQIERALLAQIPEIKQIVARTGSDEIGLDPMGLNETDVFMELAPQDEWRFETKDELKQAIREVLSRFPGINFGFTQPIQMRVSEMLTGSTGDVSIKIFGDEIQQLSHLAEVINHLTKGVAGSVDVQTSIIEGGQFVNIKLKTRNSIRIWHDFG